MLYLGIDQHDRQLTISLRDDSGDVLQARLVSTRPEKIQAFFAKLTRERLRDGESFISVSRSYRSVMLLAFTSGRKSMAFDAGSRF